MISTSVTFSPYSNYPSALTKPQAGKVGVAPESKDSPPGIVDEQKATAESQPANRGLSKQDPAKEAQDQKLIDELKKIDRNVRAHEQAHLAAAGGLAVSGASFTYRRGPDGQQYAVGGEVSIDVSPGNTPQETINKAARIKAAALAPADPSAQDRSVASAAAQMEVRAQQQLTQEKLEAQGSGNDPTSTSSPKKTEPSQASSPVAKVHPGFASYRTHSAAVEASGRQIDYAA